MKAMTLLCVILGLLWFVGSAGQPTLAFGEAFTDRTGRFPAIVRGHGFVRSNGVFTTVDAPRAGLYTVVFGIENGGLTAGSYVDENGRLHGFLRSGGGFTQIDFPGAAATFAGRVNNGGQIVGAYSDDANTTGLDLPHGFLLDNGVFTKVNFPGATRTQPFGLNNRGEIVGEYIDAQGSSHGFLLSQGAFTTIDALDGSGTIATDIDDSGWIVGFSASAGGFLRDEKGSFTPIIAPQSVGTMPLGINNRGEIVGLYFVLVNERRDARAFVLKDGVFNTIDAPGARILTFAFDINDHGQIAGAYDVINHGYIRDRRSEITVIDPPEGNVNEILSINNRDDVVGRYVDANGRNRGFLIDKRGFHSIDVPGATATATYKINDRGQIVGSYSTVGNNTGYPTHGYLLDDGVFTRFDFPGAQHTSALGVNNRGQIVGEYQDAAGMFHSFLREPDGAFRTVDVPGAQQTLIAGLNDRGQMVGQYADSNGVAHGVLLDHGAVTTIDAPDRVVTAPTAINNHGQIVGIISNGVRIRGFLLSNGVFATVMPGPFFSLGSFASGIDDRGRIAGSSF